MKKLRDWALAAQLWIAVLGLTLGADRDVLFWLIFGITVVTMGYDILADKEKP